MQEWLPFDAEDSSACGLAHISVFGSALVAGIEPSDYAMPGRMWRSRYVYPWATAFDGYFADREKGFVYLKFSSGLGIALKSDSVSEWERELESHGLPVDADLPDMDWRARPA